MKGKNEFTKAEIAQLKSLIAERCKAESSKQKSIRAEMRKLGFYGGDDFGIKDLTIEKFEELIKKGDIVILED